MKQSMMQDMALQNELMKYFDTTKNYGTVENPLFCAKEIMTYFNIRDAETILLKLGPDHISFIDQKNTYVVYLTLSGMLKVTFIADDTPEIKNFHAFMLSRIHKLKKQNKLDEELPEFLRIVMEN